MFDRVTNRLLLPVKNQVPNLLYFPYFAPVNVDAVKDHLIWSQSKQACLYDHEDLHIG